MKNPQVEHGKGLPGLDRHAWVTLAEREVFNLVDTHLAVTDPAELEARLWETGIAGPTGRLRFFPHILTEAKNNLVAEGALRYTSHDTKGGASVDLLVPANQLFRQTQIKAAVRRKGMLYARFLRWSETFGDAGEAVVRGSLAEVMHHGYSSINTESLFGEVRRIGNAQLPGALDSGAFVVVRGDDGMPVGVPHTLPVEVKNRRLTLYPRHNEVHQLLHKAALLQQQFPDQPIVPLLICRRGHDRLFWMASDLGFLAHGTRRQFLTLPKKGTQSQLEELRTELGLHDLTLVAPNSPPRIHQLFTNTIPKQAADTAARWSAVGAQLLPYYEELRDDDLTETDRSTKLAFLRSEAADLLDEAGVEEPILAWALEEERPD